METDHKIAQIFIQAHPTEAIQLLEGLPIENTVQFLNDTSLETAVQVIEMMGLSAATRCLELLEPKRSAALLEKLHHDTIAVFCRRVSTPTKEAILSLLPHQIKDPLNLCLSFPEGSAGALVDPHILTLPPDISARVALERARTYAEQVMYYLYVTDRNKKLVGVLNVRELMLAPPQALISSLMHTHLETISVHANFQTILGHAGWQKIHAIPVVDDAYTFVGTIRYETLRRIEQDARTHLTADGIEMVGSALGELYRIGLSGLVNSTTPSKQSPSQ